MISAVPDTQLIITVNNKVGTMAQVLNLVSSSGINLVAVCAYAVENVGNIMFVTEDNKLAKKLLEVKKYNVREEGVVLVTLSNKPGALEDVTKKISNAGIDLTLVYGTVEKEGIISRVVVISEDNKALLMALRLNK